MPFPDDAPVDFSQIIEALSNGTADARAEILENFRDYLRQVARQNLNSKNVFQLSVSDIVQNAIVAANNDASRCRAQSLPELKNWLKQIVLNDISNACRDLHRKKRDVQRERQLDAVPPPIANQACPATDAIRNEDELRLEFAIDCLPPDNQQVIRLRHQEDRTFVDIANIMGRSPDAVRMLWNRSIILLAREISQAQ